jgi:hypothetical protein
MYGKLDLRHLARWIPLSRPTLTIVTANPEIPSAADEPLNLSSAPVRDETAQSTEPTDSIEELEDEARDRFSLALSPTLPVRQARSSSLLHNSVRSSYLRELASPTPPLLPAIAEAPARPPLPLAPASSSAASSRDSIASRDLDTPPPGIASTSRPPLSSRGSTIGSILGSMMLGSGSESPSLSEPQEIRLPRYPHLHGNGNGANSSRDSIAPSRASRRLTRQEVQRRSAFDTDLFTVAAAVQEEQAAHEDEASTKLRKVSKWLFIVGFICPILWLVGSWPMAPETDVEGGNTNEMILKRRLEEMAWWRRWTFHPDPYVERCRWAAGVGIPLCLVAGVIVAIILSVAF